MSNILLLCRAYLRLGEFSSKANNYKEAVKMIRRASEIEPSVETDNLLKETMAYSRPDNVVVNKYPSFFFLHVLYLLYYSFTIRLILFAYYYSLFY